jgi:hypothetical protein
VLNEQNKFYSSLYSNKETEDNLNVQFLLSKLKKNFELRSPSLSQHAFDLIIAPSVFFSKYVFKSFLIVNMLFSMF